jgi:hypothetical protein
MGIAILAPVPAILLKSATDTCAAVGRVAFGTEAWEFFAKVNEEYCEGLPVLVYATPRYGDPDKLCDPGKVTFRGVYLGLTRAQAGKHPNPAVRPSATINDTDWACFWEVSDLVHLSKQDRIAVTSLAAEAQKKPLSNGFVPHGPMLVKAAFL